MLDKPCREEDPCEPTGDGATGIVDVEGNVCDGSVENYDLTFVLE